MKNHLLNTEDTKERRILTRGLVCLGAALVLFMLGGCRVEYHEHHDHRHIDVTHIVSDREADGDISFSEPATYIVSPARTTGSVLAGIDPDFGDEFRGFLDFPLRGADGVPLQAAIESASLEFFINRVDEAYPGSGVSLLIDLVSFQPPTLIAGDFDRHVQPPIMTLPMDIVAADEGIIIAVDVTSLMIEAQRLDLPDLQLRFLQDSLASAGLVEIRDGDFATAPQLSVHYY
jgi:hypothetical protein